MIKPISVHSGKIPANRRGAASGFASGRMLYADGGILAYTGKQF